jgi:hypothetical protein
MGRFLDIVRQAVDELGPDNSQLMALIHPYREYITGDDELEDLRRNLEQDRQSEETPESAREDGDDEP